MTSITNERVESQPFCDGATILALEQKTNLLFELFRKEPEQGRQILPALGKVVELMLQYSRNRNTVTEPVEIWLAKQILGEAEPTTREAAESRGDERKKQLLEAEGGCLTAAEVAERLGITRQGVDKRRAQGKLVAVTHYKRGYLYPKWQFGVEGFEKVLEALSEEDSWTLMIFMLSPVPRFEGETPLQLLRQGRLEEVLRFAETWGDTTAL